MAAQLRKAVSRLFDCASCVQNKNKTVLRYKEEKTYVNQSESQKENISTWSKQKEKKL